MFYEVLVALIASSKEVQLYAPRLGSTALARFQRANRRFLKREHGNHTAIENWQTLNVAKMANGKLSFE